MMEYLAEELSWFLKQMAHKFLVNQDKDDAPYRRPRNWHKCVDNDLWDKMLEEHDELRLAFALQDFTAASCDSLIYECADVANIACIIACRARKRKEQLECENQVK